MDGTRENGLMRCLAVGPTDAYHQTKKAAHPDHVSSVLDRTLSSGCSYRLCTSSALGQDSATMQWSGGVSSAA